MVTLKDLAKALNLSPPTVSRALRDSPRVNIRTRERVKRRAREAGYVPNHVASGLKTSQSRTIGVLTPSINMSYWATILEGIEEEANRQGYSAIIGITVNAEEERAVSANVTSMLQKRVDGIIRISHFTDYSEELMTQMRGRGIALVDVEFDGLRPPTDRVRVECDNHAGAYEATRHLIDLGYRRIGRIDGPVEISMIARQRRTGFLDAIGDYGPSAPEVAFVQCGFDFDTGLEAAEQLLGQLEPPLAIVACSDEVACAVFRVAHLKGLHVPGDLSIVGFGNREISRVLPAPLTTVEVPAMESGRLAFRQFLEQMDETDTLPRRITLSTRLLVRESTGPAR